MRIAVVNLDRCQPKKCSKECFKYCPGVRMGEETIVFSEETNKPIISEELCTGCGICTKKCPFEAIAIVNLPDELESDKVHQYSKNGFRLFRIPYVEENSVLGIIGQNAMGKTTIVRILSGELVPNFGDYESSGDKSKVLKYFSNKQHYNYFSKLYQSKLRVVVKPQYVDAIPKIFKGRVIELLERADEKDKLKEIAKKLELEDALDRKVNEISGGELQRLAIGAALLRDADVYIFDEPSSYLDVKQRLSVAKLIRSLAEENRVVVVEHDLIVLDYLADSICILYGKPGVYGIVSNVRGVRQGINDYLEGFLKDENVKFRQEPIRFEVKPPSESLEGEIFFTYPKLEKSLNGFKLTVEAGEVKKGEIIGILGQNALGKTTFVKMLANVIEPDNTKLEIGLKVSYKPQYIKPEKNMSVEEVVSKFLADPFFESEIYKPLAIYEIEHKNLFDLSGGELQRLAIAVCLAREADIYLLDEPSAYLDVEQRLRVAKMIKRAVEKRDAVGMIVDHDLMFLDYISNRMIVFLGKPSIEGHASKPLSLRDAMNTFLKDIGITFRRDQQTKRPRANKPLSRKDREQKAKGEYYYVY